MVTYKIESNRSIWATGIKSLKKAKQLLKTQSGLENGKKVKLKIVKYS